MSLIERYHAWRNRRIWTVKQQVYELRIQVEEDARWMAHDPKIAALCERYAGMLSDNWMYTARLGVSNFRLSIDAEPSYCKQTTQPAFIHQGQDACGDPVGPATPYFSAPQPCVDRKPLTDKEIDAINPFHPTHVNRLAFHTGARFAERHHKIKGARE
ncbi:hypothetical protein Pnap_2281 [Polaromonas naphthalenivorans CJ2]|uniref:Uncharacterized protein n=2 Tax=Polaromonas naphthalenivorans TaxID=216465 RepID=A1VPL1_POLNA|nr:hypothetical protein Pnap_2281 [Polaromonas naphthalenivorans CJ2]